jgi:transcriptional regulator with XRE-family HTH domain
MGRQQPMPSRLTLVRRYRKSHDLAQRELAELVGMISQRSFSEMETGLKRPGLAVALACAIALDVPVSELFPRLAENIEHDVLTRARRLYAELKEHAGHAEAVAYVAALIRRLNHPHV